MEICMPSSLDLFQRQQVQTSILKTEEIGYKPLTSLDSHSSIEFSVAGLNDTYLDLSSTTIRLKLQILDKKNVEQVIKKIDLSTESEGDSTEEDEIIEIKSESSRKKRMPKVKFKQ